MDLMPLQLFLPCLVAGDWPLLATWTKQASSPNFGYIVQLGKFHCLGKTGELREGQAASSTRISM
jgi:hypothetical protein